jgi:hypothetical protein
MPGNQWLKRLSIIHSQRRRSSPQSIVDAREPQSTLLGGSHPLPVGLQGRVGEGVSTFVAQPLVQIVAFRPLGVGALPSLNKGFGDLEIRWSGFLREKPTPVVHERWAAVRSPCASGKAGRTAVYGAKRLFMRRVAERCIDACRVPDRARPAPHLAEARPRSSISIVAVMPAVSTTPGGTSSIWMRTGMRWARRTQVNMGLTVATP